MRVNLQEDFFKILRDELVKEGYNINDKPLDVKIAHMYFNLKLRQIPNKQREIKISKEFQCPPELKGGLKLIEEKIVSGKNIKPHQSRGLLKLDYDDTLLNDWGIHHLHLGLNLENDSFMNRTGPVLFLRITDEFAYFINVMPHGSWTRQDMLKVLYKNWPESLEQFILEGALGVSFNPTDDEIKKLRKANIVTLLEIEPGVVLHSIGGGYTTSGISTVVVQKTNKYLSEIEKMETRLKANFHLIEKTVLKNGFQMPSNPEFKLIFDKNGNMGVLEKSLNIAFNI